MTIFQTRIKFAIIFTPSQTFDFFASKLSIPEAYIKKAIPNAIIQGRKLTLTNINDTQYKIGGKIVLESDEPTKEDFNLKIADLINKIRTDLKEKLVKLNGTLIGFHYDDGMSGDKSELT